MRSPAEPPRGWLGSSAFEDGGLAERGPRASPVGSRARLTRTDAGTLLVEIPTLRSLADSRLSTVLFGGSFTTLWVGMIGRFTLSALASASAGAALFSIPFWVAGAVVAKTTILDPCVGHALSIGEYAFSATTLLPGGRTLGETSGPTAELTGVRLDTSAEDGSARALVLCVRGGEEWAFGQGLSTAELRYLEVEINEHIDRMAGLGRS
jgi:hypothetical protein